MIEELTLQGIYVRSQVPVPLIYKEKILDKDFRMDLLVEHIFAVELKAVEIMHPVYKAQLLSHMKLAGIPKGLLINFNTVVIKNDLDSMVTELFAKLPE
jgi:GxxExxY protein